MVLRLVPTDFLTVQAAIDASSSGDSIKILAGKFDGFEVDVDNLKIFGCGIGRTIIEGAPAQGSDDGVVVISDRITLQDFTIQGFPDEGVRINTNFNVLKNIESKLNIGSGIQLIGDNNLIIECSILMNRDDGFNISPGQNNCILKCESNVNDGTGYSFSNVNNKLLLSTAKENIDDGLLINDSFNTIIGNISNKNNARGILVGAGDGNNNIIKNLTCNNSGSGIEIEDGAFVNAIDSNIARNNGTDVTDAGILIEDSAADNTIRFNEAKNNFEFDIEAIPPADTANTFDGNKCGNSSPPGLCT
ncbi:right-handed parallel beta-helix repeat-containing protein [Bacillus spongiae]|uniref:Right-handed parallel beta-helix repeat-containing protein n=1 Tax=Bacillus spongiae TaxID=2683610 RepID=A0ABU8HE79_9BACI